MTCDERMHDKSTGRLQDKLLMLAPWLLEALVGLSHRNPGFGGRLKAAAMQLLPALLDGLRVRQLCDPSDRGRRMTINLEVGTHTMLASAAKTGTQPALLCGICLALQLLGCAEGGVALQMSLSIPWIHDMRAPTGQPSYHAAVRTCIGLDRSSASQATKACQTIATSGLGSIVEACDSAMPFLLGMLQNWADPGAHVIAQSFLCTACTTFHLRQHACQCVVERSADAYACNVTCSQACIPVRSTLMRRRPLARLQ